MVNDSVTEFDETKPPRGIAEWCPERFAKDLGCTPWEHFVQRECKNEPTLKPRRRSKITKRSQITLENQGISKMEMRISTKMQKQAHFPEAPGSWSCGLAKDLDFPPDGLYESAKTNPLNAAFPRLLSSRLNDNPFVARPALAAQLHPLRVQLDNVSIGSGTHTWRTPSRSRLRPQRCPLLFSFR